MGYRPRPLLLLALAVLAAFGAVSTLGFDQPAARLAPPSEEALAARPGPAPRLAAPQGIEAFSYGRRVTIRGERATAEETESKLFYSNDNRWWAVLGTSGGPSRAPGLYVYELVDRNWEPRVQLPGADPWAKADTVFDPEAAKLYVAARAKDSPSSGESRVSKLYELTYKGAGRWSSPAGPSTITSKSPEVLTITLDSRDRVWTSFMAKGALQVGYKGSTATDFTYVPLPVTRALPDDVSAVVSWAPAGAGRIGILWSDQHSGRFRFAWREDAAPISKRSWKLETAYGGPATVGGCPTESSAACADDHISLKAAGGQVYAAVKTSLNDAPLPDPSDPLIVLLARREDAPSWEASPVVPVAQKVTNPTLVLAPELDGLYLFAPRGGTVYLWASSLTRPAFGGAIPWIRSTFESTATSTKQVVSKATGAVVVASHHSRQSYLYNQLQFTDTLSDAAQSPTPLEAGPSPPPERW